MKISIVCNIESVCSYNLENNQQLDECDTKTNLPENLLKSNCKFFIIVFYQIFEIGELHFFYDASGRAFSL